MSDFIERFGDNGGFSAAREGTIVGLLCIGALIGSAVSAPLADSIGYEFFLTRILGLALTSYCAVVDIPFPHLLSFTLLALSSRSQVPRPGCNLPLVDYSLVSVSVLSPPPCRCTNPRVFQRRFVEQLSPLTNCLSLLVSSSLIW